MKRFAFMFTMLFVVWGAVLGIAGPCSTPDDDCSNGIVYDRGDLNSVTVYSSTLTDLVLVQEFTPLVYPWRIDAVCVVLNHEPPMEIPRDVSLDYEVVMFAADGAGGAPGTEVAAVADSAVGIPDYWPGRFFSTDVSGIFPEVTEGTVYLGLRWNPSLYQEIGVFQDSGIVQVSRYVRMDNGVWQTPVVTGVWGIRARGSGFVDPTPSEIVRPDAPGLVGDLRLWLRGDDLTSGHAAGDDVSLWSDASGASHDATALSGGFVNPRFNLSEVPAVRFRASGNNELMRADDLLGGALPTDLTILAVYSTEELNSGMRPVGFGSIQDGSNADNFNLACDPSIRKDNGSITGYTRSHPSDFLVRTAMMDATSGDVEDWFDGDQVLSSAANFTVSTDDFYLGDLRNADNANDVKVAEALVFDRSLTTQEREGVEAYIDAKYRSRLYHRYEEGAAGAVVSSVLDHTFNANDGTPMAAAASMPVFSADVPVAAVPLTGSENMVSLDLERDEQQYIEVGASLVVDLDNDLTVEAWVRLETLSDGGDGIEDRQYLVWKAAADATDAEVGYGLLVQAGDLAGMATVGTGTDHGLMLWLGDGVQYDAVLSALEITDTEWHHVSAAYDRDAATVRFAVDGRVDTVGGLTVVPAMNSGPLLIGAHAASGAVDASFDGRIDELRISGRTVPVDQLLDLPGLIFLDGFESATTSAWSDVVP